MSHFAKVINGKVTKVIVAEPEFLQTYLDDAPGEWIQTSYNTYAGVHELGGTPLRKNFAGIGFVYDKERDAFYEPQPYPSWTLNEQTCLWEPPIAKPNGLYSWNETEQKWDISPV